MILTFIMSVTLGICANAQSANSGKIVGQVGLIEGKVLVDSRPVQKNSSVREGSIIEVGKSSRATLILGKGSVFNLSAESKMVISEYGMKDSAGRSSEAAALDLKFGRTRALILNQGDRRDIRIKARAATMGVRGTEIFIDAPRDVNRPIQFFTLEGKADVVARPGAPVVPLVQNQGIAASGNGPSTGNGAGNAEGRTAGLNVSQVKEEIKNAGLAEAGAKPSFAAAPPPGPGRGAPGSLSDQLGVGALAPFPRDPIADGQGRLIEIRTKFCNATATTCP